MPVRMTTATVPSLGLPDGGRLRSGEGATLAAAAVLRLYCHACRRGRPALGFSRYAVYQFCNLCATEFEAAQSWMEQPSVGQFVRDKQFGEADRYALADA